MIDVYREAGEIAQAIVAGELDVVEGADAIRDLAQRRAKEVADFLDPIHDNESEGGGDESE